MLRPFRSYKMEAGIMKVLSAVKIIKQDMRVLLPVQMTKWLPSPLTKTRASFPYYFPLSALLYWLAPGCNFGRVKRVFPFIGWMFSVIRLTNEHLSLVYTALFCCCVSPEALCNYWGLTLTKVGSLECLHSGDLKPSRLEPQILFPTLIFLH